MKYFRSFFAGAVMAAAVVLNGSALAAPNSALESARQAEKNNDERLASLYYFNAMANDRHSLAALKEYAAMIERRAARADDPERVSQLYGALLSLAQVQAGVVAPELIPSLDALIGELNERFDSALKQTQERLGERDYGDCQKNAYQHCHCIQCTGPLLYQIIITLSVSL